jgi:L-ascorbate metabolism protein UlaG (beta-lactamase superfamily)
MKSLLRTVLPLAVLSLVNGAGFAQQERSKIDFFPITHASFVIVAGSSTIYVDPTGDQAAYGKFPAPNIILVTHTHPDHFDKKLIAALKKQKTIVIGPRAVVDDLTYGEILNNGQSTTSDGIGIEAIPSYNTTPERLQYHPKGKGNGYVVTVEGKRVYISGDTEDIPEMRNLKNIDYAFVCMNLPYTMSVEQAASAVLAFQPKVVFPYHYRQKDGFSDINKFRQLVGKNKNIEVRFLKWYK